MLLKTSSGSKLIISDEDRREIVMVCLENGTKLNNRYTIVNRLSDTSFVVNYAGFDEIQRRECCIAEFFLRYGTYRNRLDGMVQALTSAKQKKVNIYITKYKRMVDILTMLQYEGIVPEVYDVFSQNNTYYCVMEYIHGQSMEELIERNGGILSLEYVKFIALNAGNALIKVHNKGIIHGNVCPGRIWITDYGNVKLTGFDRERQWDYNGDEISDNPLRENPYLPIEAYSKKKKIEKGFNIDLYGFAGSLYYALTGQMIPDVIDRLESDYKKLTEYGFSRRLSDVFDRALAIYPNERTKSVTAFLEEICATVKFCS